MVHLTMGVTNPETIETRLRRVIIRDLVPSPSVDPLGNVTYLFFLLRNQIENPLTDQLVDWLNSWVDRVINRAETGRYIDREIVSAVFGHCVLVQYNRSRVNVDQSQIVKLLKPFRGVELIFENLTYTLLLSYADSVLGLGLIPRDDVEATLVKRSKDRSLFNDGKNVAFACMLLDRLQSQALDSLLDESFKFAEEGAVPFDERIFYSWVLWKHRERWKNSDLRFITKYVDSSLTNFLDMLDALSDNPGDPELALVYGEDNRRRFSKILLGFALDLNRDFEQKTIRISEQELKTAPIVARIGGLALAGLALYFPTLILLMLSESGYLLHKATLQDPLGLIRNLSIGIASIMLFAGAITFAAGIFWDLTVKGVFSDKLILEKLDHRLRTFVFGIVAVAIVSTLVGFVLGSG